jgi:hypothetical protein
VSSLTSTLWARGLSTSIIKEVIPTLQQASLIRADQSSDFPRFISRESTTPLQPDRVKPEFGRARLPFYVDVRRLLVIARVEKEPVRTKS